jgi:hypothetical protein
MSTMIEILERIIDTKGAGSPAGLCGSLVVAEDWDHDRISSIWARWEHFSGDPLFPVPDPNNRWGGAAVLVYEATEYGTFYAGEYGKLRLDLARHLLTCLRQNV